jgi:hypothetical protein
MQFIQILSHLSLNKMKKRKLDFYGSFFAFELRCNPLWSMSFPNAYLYFSYTQYMQNYYDYEKNSLKILMYLHVFSPRIIKKWFLVCRLYVCIYEHLTSTWMVGQSLFIFSIQEFIHSRSVFSESEHSNSKNEPFRCAKKHKMMLFSKTPLTVLIKFQKFKTS